MKSSAKIWFCVFLAGCFFFCSKKEKRDVKPVVNYKDVVSRVVVKPEKPLAYRPVQAELEYKVPQFRHLISLSYQWLVNGKAVPGVVKRTLLASHFKKHDTLQCLIEIRQGKKILKRIKSKKVRVANSPPSIKERRIRPFSVPGVFVHQIQATDADNDELSYRLLSPLNQEIRVNAFSGEVRWEITTAVLNQLFREQKRQLKDDEKEAGSPPEQSQVVVEIIIEVLDDDEAIVPYTMVLRLVKKGDKFQSGEDEIAR